MRLAALYDIHGNLPALEAVVDELRSLEVDRIVVGGDVVPGPMSHEALELLLALDIPAQFIYGNCETAVLAELAGKDPGVPPQVRETIRWTAQNIGSEPARVFAGWPMTLRLEIPPIGDVLFCHATPRNENEIFSRSTPEDRLLPVFAALDGVTLVVCGHTHMQFDRMVGKIRVVNAGSVGMPFGPPGADWLLLGRAIELRHTSYDLEKAAARIRATNYPQAEDFAANYVLNPPAAEKMLVLFSQHELKA
jgi:putative phosphoesterase